VALGESGRDGLVEEAGSNRLMGGSGRDLLVGGDDGDRSWGGPGADVLYGNSGSDHVSQVKPSIIGADLLSGRGDQGPAPQRFDQAGGAKLILSVRPSQIFLQENELARGGHSLADVARYMRTLKTGAIAKSAVPPGERNKDAFDAAIPAPWLRQLPCVPGP
jgi:hypothetical protein